MDFTKGLAKDMMSNLKGKALAKREGQL